jgi:hypothetical protein
MATVEELRERFDDHDVHSDLELLSWLKELFEACDAARCEVPGGYELARAISVTRQLPPNPGMPPNPPPQDGGDRAKWLIRESITVLDSAPSPVEGKVSAYAITAYAIGTWLLTRQHPPRVASEQREAPR